MVLERSKGKRRRQRRGNGQAINQTDAALVHCWLLLIGLVVASSLWISLHPSMVADKSTKVVGPFAALQRFHKDQKHVVQDNDRGIPLKQVLQRLKGLLETRWKESSNVSPELLHAVQNETSINKCWAPSIDSTACHVKEYMILAPIQLFEHHKNSTLQEQLREVVLHTLQWLYDPTATQIQLLISPASIQKALRKNDEYGVRLAAWHKDPKHRVKLTFSDSLSQAMAQMRVTSQTPRAVIWRSVQEPWPLTWTRTRVQDQLQGWKEQASVALGGNDWNGLAHHVDYLCFLLTPPLAKFIETPWDVLWTVGHVSSGLSYDSTDMAKTVTAATTKWGGLPPRVNITLENHVCRE